MRRKFVVGSIVAFLLLLPAGPILAQNVQTVIKEFFHITGTDINDTGNKRALWRDSSGKRALITIRNFGPASMQVSWNDAGDAFRVDPGGSSTFFVDRLTVVGVPDGAYLTGEYEILEVGIAGQTPPPAKP